MDTFLQQPGLSQRALAQPFAMEQMRRELDKASSVPSRTTSSGWTSEFSSRDLAQPGALRMHTGNAFSSSRLSSAEFETFQQLDRSGSSRTGPSVQANFSGYTQPYMYRHNFMGIQSQPYMPTMSMPRSLQQTAEGKGKGKMVELDDTNWEQQFAEMDTTEEYDLDDRANADIERELGDVDRSVPSETLEGDFESIWQGIQAERLENREWLEKDLDANLAEIDDMDYNPFDGFDSLSGQFRDPQLGEYLFEQENIYQNTANPFGEGMAIMESAGNLSLAALAFEAAVQKNPEHVEAWVMLGTAQAQNEKESPAIRALEQALKLDGRNLDALMGLAVSYTNEGYDATAYRTLERWLSVKYPQVISPDNLSSPSEIGFTDRHALHEKVTNLFIKAAQLSPDGEHMDPDVQVGLGVLFYGAEEFDKAVDCFTSALHTTESGTTNQRNQVHLLWNRLGATLANGGRPEEAIAAYTRALTMNSNFVRARYNLGVSCINISCYQEAAGHLLAALNLHSTVRRQGMELAAEVAEKGDANPVDEAQIERLMNMNQSTNLYETLRRVFGQMGRRDLAERVVPGMNVDTFRNEFDF